MTTEDAPTAESSTGTDVSTGPSRRLRPVFAGLAAAALALSLTVLTACGDDEATTKNTQPDPRASTAGQLLQSPEPAVNVPPPSPVPTTTNWITQP